MRHAFDVPSGQNRSLPPAQPPVPSLRFWLSAVAGSVLASALIVVFGYDACGGLPSTSSNLRMIAQVAVAHAYEHPQGHFPDSFQDLVRAQAESLHPSIFIAPPGDETAALSFEQMFDEPGHVSFVWTGRGLNLQNITEEAVTAYQARSTRQDGQVWVAFADGTARRLTVAELQDHLRATADLVAGELSRLPDVSCTLTAPPAISASPE